MDMPKELAEALDKNAKDQAAVLDAVGKLIEALTEKPEPKPVEEATKIDLEALIEAGLTKTARTRVLAAAEGGADLTEAIKAEKELAKEILAEAEKSGEFSANLEESGKGEAKPLINW